MKVFVIYVEYGLERRDSLTALQKWLSSSFLDIPVTLIVVQNNHSIELAAPTGTTMIRGSNDFHEFSAWQLALDQNVLPNAGDNDLVVLANDSLVANYGEKVFELFRAQEFMKKLNQGLVIGYEDRYLNPVTLMGVSGHRWLRSNLIIFRIQELQLVLPLVSPLREERIFAGTGPSLFKREQDISKDYADLLDCWLHRAVRGRDLNSHWHGSEILTPASRPRLEQKARMIFFEFLLSQRILHQAHGWWNVRTSIRNKMGLWWLASKLGIHQELQSLGMRFRRFKF